MSLRVESNLEWHGEEVKIRGKRVLEGSAFELGLVIEDQAVHLAPVDTGRLRGSITTQTRHGEGTETVAPATSGDKVAAPREQDVLAVVGSAVDYAPWQEFGTVRTDAQPFLRPALALAKGQELTIVRRNARWHFAEYMR